MGRRVMVVVVLACGALLSSAGAALAAPSSSITAPAGPAYALQHFNSNPPAVVLTVTGTTTGFPSNKGDLRCYFSAAAGNAGSYLIAVNVDTSGGSFSQAVTEDKLFADFFSLTPCQLRMVPAGDTGAHPVGDNSDPFAGPLLATSYNATFAMSGIAYDAEADATSTTSSLRLASAGFCGVVGGGLVNSSFLHVSSPFDCAAKLTDGNATQSAPTSTASSIQVDGIDSYDTWGMSDMTATTVPGFLPFTETRTFDPATGLSTITLKEPIMQCAAGQVAYPPNQMTNCPSVRSAGVELDRTYKTSSDNHILDMTDVWFSTDGRAHTLKLRMQNGMSADKTDDGAYQLPGQSSFAVPALNAAHTFPAGPGTILYKVDSLTPDGGDTVSAQASISYSPAPDGAAVFTYDNLTNGLNELTWTYSRTVPASGSFTLRMRFAQDLALPPVQAAAAAAIATYTPPTVAIGSPTTGTTVTTPTVAVSGTVSGSVGINSVTVNGVAATLGSGGSWSATVPLTAGANTLTATALDASGSSATASASVTYAPTSGGGSPTATVSGGASVSGTAASVKVLCQGAAGSSCTVSGVLSSTEHLSGNKVVAVTARKKQTKKTAKVGSKTVTIPAGSTTTLKVPLNGTGKALLARFGKLPSTLKLTSAGRTVLSSHLTFKKKKPKKKH